MREELRKTWCWLAHRRHRQLLVPAIPGLSFFPFDYEDVVYCSICDTGGTKAPETWVPPNLAFGAA